MEIKHQITFRTFKNYCKHHHKGYIANTCGLTLKPGRKTQWCEKKHCPLFKKLKRTTECEKIRYWPSRRKR